jgi:hypothetical protein
VIAFVGRLKGRYRVLKIPNKFQKLDEVANEFRACCVIYNMLHYHAERESRWDENFELENLKSMFDDSVDESEGLSSLTWLRKRFLNQIRRVGANPHPVQVDATFDASGTSAVNIDVNNEEDDGDDNSEIESAWKRLQCQLVKHFTIAKANKEIG